MQFHDHVTRLWPRCRQVELEGENLACDVDWDRRYDLADKRPQLHLRFLNLKTDVELMEFTRAWGPLWCPSGATQVIVPRARCWALQKWLKAGLNLARNARFDDAARLAAAILEFVAADDENWCQDPFAQAGGWEGGWAAAGLRHLDPEHRHPKDWVPGAPVSVLRKAATECPMSTLEFSLQTAWQDRRLHFSWKPTPPPNLSEAIKWEAWSSLTGTKPITICAECQTAFLPDSAHPRKFCSYPCAHRVAMRMWRKNNPEGPARRKRGKHAKAKKA
jgi:hypothetical protein